MAGLFGSKLQAGKQEGGFRRSAGLLAWPGALVGLLLLCCLTAALVAPAGLVLPPWWACCLAAALVACCPSAAALVGLLPPWWACWPCWPPAALLPLLPPGGPGGPPRGACIDKSTAPPALGAAAAPPRAHTHKAGLPCSVRQPQENAGGDGGGWRLARMGWPRQLSAIFPVNFSGPGAIAA